MVYMAKIYKSLLIVLFIILSSTNVYAAKFESKITKDRVEFIFSFTKGYSNFSKLSSGNMNIYTFETTENLEEKDETYIDSPIKKATLSTDGSKKTFIVEFKELQIEPIIKTVDKEISIVFPLPVSNEPATTLNADKQIRPNAQGPGITDYIRMLFSLLVVLVIIFSLFWVLKNFFKKQVFSDIPGSGRLLGKVDLELKKSLYFYEVGDIIYILGVTDGSINLLDKITDEAEATKIRAGFIKKTEFKGYMSFFKNRDKNSIDDDLANSNLIVEEKLKTLRNKNNR